MADDRAQIEGRYSNHFEIGQNAFEFLLEFGQSYEGPEQNTLVHTRIILNPFYAKNFSEMLRKSVCRYEAHYGAIPNEEP